MDGRDVYPEWKMFYKPIGEDLPLRRDVGQHHVRFLDACGLGQEVYNVFDYFLTGQYKFYHIMIRALLFDAFCRQDLRDVFFLPYWTNCDGDHQGMVEKVPERRHHRHMIIMMTEERHNSFQKMWQSLILGTGGMNKKKKPIKSVEHLMNVINYVSRPEDKKKHRSHYWIHRPFQRHARWAIAYLFRGGHELLLRKLNKNKHITSYFDKIRNEGTTRNPNYVVKVGYLNMDPVTCRIPFADGYVPCPIRKEDGDGDYPIVYEFGERKALKYVPEQREGYSCWQSIRNRDYRLGKLQTNVMNQLRVLVKRQTLELTIKLIDCRKKRKRSQVETEKYRKETEKYRTKMERYRTETEKYRKETERYRTETEKYRKENESLQEMLRLRDVEFASTINQPGEFTNLHGSNALQHCIRHYAPPAIV
ncbi:hypothetical protein JTE90_002479 [Oedothorax gibbosus]|uniref:Uncharacterized protein n=1 Tax=Oedothorax gibbosus TaxID=931172 RepID=A0AAV6TSC9_9ARAC|nr:hypothetical protein JTE90_002479 [Oedothorax gibbosus]